MLVDGDGVAEGVAPTLSVAVSDAVVAADADGDTACPCVPRKASSSSSAHAEQLFIAAFHIFASLPYSHAAGIA